MSREIKFRVWDGEKMWHPNEDDNSQFIVIGDSGYFELQDHSPENFGKSQSIVGHRDLAIINNADNQDAILMQYTGLKDKNGVEIYEGDIVTMKSYNFQHMNDLKWEVRYVAESMAFMFYCKPKKNSEAYEDIAGWHSFEVIGNIYENKNILNH